MTLQDGGFNAKIHAAAIKVVDPLIGFSKLLFFAAIACLILYGLGRWAVSAAQSYLLKCDVGDIYENQLTRNRFMITEARLGTYYIDSLQAFADSIVKPFQSNHIAVPQWVSSWLNEDYRNKASYYNRYDTYILCTDPTEFLIDPKTQKTNFSQVNQRLYRKIN